MKKLLIAINILFSIIFINQNLYGQPKDTVVIIRFQDNNTDAKTKVYDTILPDALNYQNVLIGTTILYGSKNNWNASFLNSIILDKIEYSECSSPFFKGKLLKNQIMSITKKDSLWIIDTKIIEHCCNSFLCEIEIVNNTTISLNYISYGYNCDCTCCYGIKYYIINWPNKKIKYFMINRKKKTLKQYK